MNQLSRSDQAGRFGLNGRWNCAVTFVRRFRARSRLEAGCLPHHICSNDGSKETQMTTVKIDKNNFQADVLQAAEPVVVDFWAEWCGPCKMIAPALDEIATEMGGKVKIAKVNIDENPELAAQFGVRSIPTLMIFKGGEVADMKVGAAPKTALSSWISGNV
jgi:thioredoxin 1